MNLPSLLAPLLKHKVVSRFPQQAVTHARALAVHTRGVLPVDLLKTYRPGESEEIRKYRLASYEPKTTSAYKKVLNVLYKIFSSKLYQIQYPEPPAALSPALSLKTYLEEEIPYGFGSLLNYAQHVLLSKMLEDPNGLLLILPTDFSVGSDHFVTPFPYFFSSDHVIDYEEDNYCLVQSSRSRPITLGEKEIEGEVYYLVDRYQIRVVEQVDSEEIEKLFKIKPAYTHNIGYLPAVQLGGRETYENDLRYYSSFIAEVIPHWNEVIRLASDLQAAYVQHMYPERVEVEKECPRCGGKGKVYSSDGTETICPTCGGSGNLNARTPYGTTYFSKGDGLDDVSEKLFPGVVYIQKDISIVEILEKRIEKERQLGFEAINMEVIGRIGENQSGIAKAYDRSELNNYLLQVSDRMWWVIDQLIFFLNRYRYQTLLGEQVDAYLPTIVPPRSFEVLSDEELLAEIRMAQDAGADKESLKELKIHQAKRRHGEDSVIARRIETILRVNPHAGKNTDDLLALNALGVLREVDKFICANIEMLVDDAYLAHEDFFDWPMKERKAYLYQAAKQLLAEQVRQLATIPTETVSTETVENEMSPSLNPANNFTNNNLMSDEEDS